MSLELRRQRNGKMREHWYGSFVDADGERKVINTGVRWAGTPPASWSLRDQGDVSFERSRAKAEEVLASFAGEASHKGRAEHLFERLVEMKTGEAVEHVRIADLAERWLSIPRDSDLSKGYSIMCKSIMNRFVLFMQSRNRKAVYLYQVNIADVTAFANEVKATMSPKTYREHLRLLRPAFDRFLPPGSSNPFRKAFLKLKSGKTGGVKSIHRIPFTEAELEKIFDGAKNDALMYPLLVTAACTGMRRGDICLLEWSSVDLKKGEINVSAAKTGERLRIPIFPRLRSVLAPRVGNGSKLVFPEAAQMLKNNPGGLSYRCKVIMARALDEVPISNVDVPSANIVNEGVAEIRSNVPEGTRRDRMIDVLRRYVDGQGIRTIEKEIGASRSNISNDLHAVECWTGKTIMREKAPNIKAAIARTTQAKRDKGPRSASVRDFHAMRTSFVTLALTRGTPIELVKKITGHQTTSIVLEHYFRPGADDFRKALASTLPDVLTGSASTRASKKGG
jgi:integrase